jgi:acylphosphatase
MSNMKIRAHVFVSGKVQGVFFRVETRNEAMKRNVVGWVRNTSNGRVEAIFEGEKADVEQLIVFCRKGPPGAGVTKTDIHYEEYTGDFETFKIRRTILF